MARRTCGATLVIDGPSRAVFRCTQPHGHIDTHIGSTGGTSATWQLHDNGEVTTLEVDLPVEYATAIRRSPDAPSGIIGFDEVAPFDEDDFERVLRMIRG